MGVEQYRMVNTSTVSATVVTGVHHHNQAARCGTHLPGQSNASFAALILTTPWQGAQQPVANQVTNNFFLLVPRSFSGLPGVPFVQDTFTRMMEQFERNLMRNQLLQQKMQDLLQMEILRLMRQVLEKMLLLDLLKALLSRKQDKRDLKRQIEQLEDEITRTTQQAMENRATLALITTTVVA